jgi:hypothetical protein
MVIWQTRTGLAGWGIRTGLFIHMADQDWASRTELGQMGE